MGQKVGDRRGEGRDVDPRRLEFLAAGEGEQAADEFGALLGRAAGHRNDLLLLVIERNAALDQSDPAKHRGEEVVEVVRDPAGQLADCVQPAGLDQLRLELLAIGDVEQGSGEFDRMVVARREAAPTGRGNICSFRRHSASDIRSNGPCPCRAPRSPR